MNKPLTRERLDEIAARLEAATPGVCGYRESGYCGGATYRLGVQFTDRGGMRLGDAEFHSHAAADVAALLDALRWRRAGDELPEVDSEVIVRFHFGLIKVAVYNVPLETGYWTAMHDYEVHPDDRWLPLPPRGA